MTARHVSTTGSDPVMFGPRDFVDVDAFPRPDEAIAMLDFFRGNSEGAQERHAEVARSVLLELRPGERVLDVGCGLGHDAVAMAAIVGPAGSVVGTDKSATFVDEARRRTAGAAAVEFRQADATALPFEDESFDAVHVHRVLMYVPDPARAVAEVLRVLRPGGRALFVEPDAAADFADHPDERLGDLLAPMIAHVPQPRIGRQLRRLAITAGFGEVRTDGYLATLETPPPPPIAHTVFGGLVEAGVVSEAELPSLVDWVTQAGRAGTLFAAQVVVRALAIKARVLTT